MAQGGEEMSPKKTLMQRFRSYRRITSLPPEERFGEEGRRHHYPLPKLPETEELRSQWLPRLEKSAWHLVREAEELIAYREEEEGKIPEAQGQGAGAHKERRG